MPLIDAPDPPMLDSPDRLHALTREYARYSQSAGGLAAVIGGGLCLTAYIAGGLLPMSTPLRIALVATPFLWLLLKQAMARHYYQRLGQVEQLTTPDERHIRLMLTTLTAAISIVVAATSLTGKTPFGTPSWDLRTAGYVSVVLSLPVIAWYWLRSPLELAVGAFLFCQAALAFGGSSYPLWSSAVVFPVAALLLIRAGARDHRKFLALRAEIRTLVKSRQAAA